MSASPRDEWNELLFVSTCTSGKQKISIQNLDSLGKHDSICYFWTVYVELRTKVCKCSTLPCRLDLPRPILLKSSKRPWFNSTSHELEYLNLSRKKTRKLDYEKSKLMQLLYSNIPGYELNRRVSCNKLLVCEGEMLQWSFEILLPLICHSLY